MQLPIRSTSTTDAFITAAENVTRSKAIWSDSVIQTERCSKSTKPHWRKLLFFETLVTPSLKCGGATLPDRNKPILSCKPSWKCLNWFHPLNRETRFLVAKPAPLRCTPKQRRAKISVMLISPACTQALTNMALNQWDSRASCTNQTTRTLMIILVSLKSISLLRNACTTPLLFLFPGLVLPKS